MTVVLIAVARFLWTVAVVRWGVTWLRPDTSDEPPVTFGQAMLATVGLAAMWWVFDLLWHVPLFGFGAPIVAGAIWLATWAWGFRLGVLRALAMIPVQVAGQAVFSLVVYIIDLTT